MYTLLVTCFFFFFFNDTATTEIYTLSLHDALPIHVVAIDHHLVWRGRMRVGVVCAVGHRDAVAVGGHPPRPAVLRHEDLVERIHLVSRLVERVLVKRMRSRVTGLRPPTLRRVVGQAAALGLEDEDAVDRMRDHEIRLPLVRTVRARQDPVDGVVHDVLRTELLEEPFVEPALRGARRREHRERDHSSHGPMLTTNARWTSRRANVRMSRSQSPHHPVSHRARPRTRPPL